jgi:hypothetical protein
VRDFIAAERETAVAESQQARQQYSTGLEQARLSSLATLAEVVPHLAGLQPAQFEQGLAVLAQVDPPAFQQAMNILGRTHQIVQAQQQDQQQRSYAQQQQFETYGKAEDAKFRGMFGNDQGELQKVATQVVEYCEDIGIGRDRLVHMLRTNPEVRSAEGQKILADAAKYRAMQKTAMPRATRNLPPVQKPGISAPRGEAEHADVQALDARLSKTGSVKDAEKLLFARLARSR